MTNDQKSTPSLPCAPVQALWLRLAPFKLYLLGAVVVCFLAWLFVPQSSNPSDDSGMSAEQYASLPLEKLQQLAAQSDPTALVVLADYYLSGEKVTLDPKKAKNYLEQAVLSGNATAQFKYGMLLFDGFRPSRQQLKNLELAQEQMSQGNTSPPVSTKSSDLRIPMDRAEAVSLLSKSASQGYAPAQFQMGLICQKGIGVERSYSDAFNWFKQAALQGDMDAQFAVAEMYEKGYGVRYSSEQALHWYSLAGAQGHAEALYILGRVYERGENVPQDLLKAQEYYGQACDNGLQNGCTNYRRLNLKLK